LGQGGTRSQLSHHSGKVHIDANFDGLSGNHDVNASITSEAEQSGVVFPDLRQFKRTGPSNQRLNCWDAASPGTL
jgi:hypothetical protein